METSTVEVRQIDVPPEARELSTLDRVDYADAFVVDTEGAPDRSAEEWARAVLEDAPAATRATLQSGWTTLGLKIDLGGSADSILGWPIRERSPDVVLLGADSRVGMPAQLLVKVEPDTVLFCTFVQHDNPAVRVAWAAVEPVHVPIVRRILAQARGRQSSSHER
jgi:hypothetical protein